jgi:hypothetical protein
VRYSIQEYLKKINSSISLGDCLSLLTTTVILLGAAYYFYYMSKISQSPVIYDSPFVQAVAKIDERPFASKLGKTYTFDWCQSASTILEKNKLYFKDEIEAQSSGRTLSKLCK